METKETFTRYDRSRDKYGRSNHTLMQFYPYKVLGVVCKLPQGYVEKYGKEQSYLVNHRTRPVSPEKPYIHEVTYHSTLKAAKAALEAGVQA